MSKQLAFAACALAVSGLALAKLPPLDDAAKAKAAEAAAKAAWQGKLDAFQLCKAQDRVAALVRKGAATRPVVNVPAAATVPTAATPSNAANPTTASQGGGTPAPAVAAAPAIPACADPGPFAYNPPSQTPLETSGAHSPAGNASSPPSVRPDSATMAPAKAATAQSKQKRP